MGSVQCKRCGKEVSPGDVRYVSPDTYYCVECFAASQGKTRSAVGSRGEYDASPAKKVTLVCDECGFTNRFSVEGSAKRRCGYCGGESLSESGTSAARLLKEADDADTGE